MEITRKTMRRAVLCENFSFPRGRPPRHASSSRMTRTASISVMEWFNFYLSSVGKKMISHMITFKTSSTSVPRSVTKIALKIQSSSSSSPSPWRIKLRFGFPLCALNPSVHGQNSKGNFSISSFLSLLRTNRKRPSKISARRRKKHTPKLEIVLMNLSTFAHTILSRRGGLLTSSIGVSNPLLDNWWKPCAMRNSYPNVQKKQKNISTSSPRLVENGSQAQNATCLEPCSHPLVNATWVKMTSSRLRLQLFNGRKRHYNLCERCRILMFVLSWQWIHQLLMGIATTLAGRTTLIPVGLVITLRGHPISPLHHISNLNRPTIHHNHIINNLHVHPMSSIIHLRA